MSWWTIALAALLAAACGGKTEIETCGVGGPVPFERSSMTIPCQGDERVLFAVRNEADWAERCSGRVTVDLERLSIIGYFLEGDCKYSGCNARAPLITAIQQRGCRLEVAVREPEPGELGFCHACLQPGDVVLVASERADGLLAAQ